MQVPIEVRARGKLAVEIYEGCIKRGESVLLAEMLAMQQAPRGMTDDVFFEGIGTLEQQFGGGDGAKQLEELVARSQAAGHTPGYNDYYVAGIADYPGDPKAFVPRTGGRAHVKKVLEDKGWSTLEGSAVSVKGREPESDPFAPVEPSQKKNRKKK